MSTRLTDLVLPPNGKDSMHCYSNSTDNAHECEGQCAFNIPPLFLYVTSWVNVILKNQYIQFVSFFEKFEKIGTLVVEEVHYYHTEEVDCGLVHQVK